LVRIVKSGNRRIKLLYSNADDINRVRKFVRIYNPVLRFTKAGKNGDIDCKTSILYKNEAWIGELFFLIENLERYKIEYKVMFKYQRNINKEKYLLYMKSLNFKYTPRNYQLKAVYDVLNYNYVTGESITGTGKSLIISTLCKIMIDKRYKTLVIVPKKSLVEQMCADMIDYFGENFGENIQKMNSDYFDRVFKNNIIISTWQTLQNLSTESFLRFDCVIADECDIMSTYNSKYRNIVMSCENAKYVLGMTGTMPKKHFIDYHNIIGVLGKHIVYTTEKKMMKAGIISNINISTKKLYYSNDTFNNYITVMDKNDVFVGDIVETKDKKWFVENVEDYNIDVCGKIYKITDVMGMTKFKSGDVVLDRKWFKTKTQFQREIEFISGIKVRLEYITNLVNSLTGNILILTSFKDSESIKYLNYFNGKVDKNIMYVHSGVSTNDREEMFNTLETSNNNVNRGVSINNLQHFVMLSSIKNASTVRQMIGRVIRLDGKENSATVYRKETYKERGFKIKEEKIKLED